jgi:hypothetical protein
MSVGGIILDPEEETPEHTSDHTLKERKFSKYNTADLDDQLLKAIENEDYERASIIRDEINKRKK